MCISRSRAFTRTGSITRRVLGHSDESTILGHGERAVRTPGYPAAATGATAAGAHLPYDITGWTLPLQMGVSVDAISDPMEPAQRAMMTKIDQVKLPDGEATGEGSIFAVSHKPNAVVSACECGLSRGRQRRDGIGSGESVRRGGKGCVYNQRAKPFRHRCSRPSGRSALWRSRRRLLMRFQSRRPKSVSTARGTLQSTKDGRDGYWKTTTTSQRTSTTQRSVWRPAKPIRRHHPSGYEHQSADEWVPCRICSRTICGRYRAGLA